MELYIKLSRITPETKGQGLRPGNKVKPRSGYYCALIIVDTAMRDAAAGLQLFTVSIY